MGNENSILDECKFDSNKIVEVGEWQLHNGTWQKSSNNRSKPTVKGFDEIEISVFERTLSPNASKRELEFHENATKYLKVFRHPSIVKYYHSGHRNSSTLYLITERVEPLTRRLQYLSELEICAGLHSILQAMVFCHEMCKARHNNFGMESVYVTPTGVWKLSGMEFLCFQANLDESFLERNRAFRNESLIPPEEMEGKFGHLSKCGHAGDVYAMGLFAKCLLEIIIKSENSLSAKEFMEQIKKEVLIPDPTLRPQMRSLLNNRFFQNDFLEIHTFLMNFTLKLDTEKENFFRTLAPRLFRFPEKLIAVRLSDLLLSRFVLLDLSANEFFLPHFFRPRRGAAQRNEFIEDQVNPLLSASSYVEHIIPKLKYIFEVLDVDIRMILLTYFEHYVDLFSQEELTKSILPQILLGIRDVNNALVAISLRALSMMVPLLGSQVVIGGKRCQYFSEAKPKESSVANLISGEEILTDLSQIIEAKSIDGLVNNKSNCVETSSEIIAGNRERSPPPQEAVPSFESVNADVQEGLPGAPGFGNDETATPAVSDDGEWSDWDGVENDGKALDASADEGTGEDVVVASHGENEDACARQDPELLHSGLKAGSERELDLAKLKRLNGCSGLGEEFDVMAIEVKKSSNELNFFQDMQPLISRLTDIPALLDDGRRPPPPSKAELSFAVDERVEVMPNGWCEDLNWSEDL